MVRICVTDVDARCTASDSPQRELSDADVEELAQLCKKAHGLNGREVVPLPMAAGHVQITKQAGSVSVASITHLADVNALAPGETLSFSKTGLTVVYGDNGAGKTGYARILKRACRARGSSEPVLPNALSEQAAGAPTAKLKVDVDGVETEHVWKEDAACARELGAVSVFDSSAAQVYVSDRTEVRFRPFGLDVLDRLAVACGKVKTRLDQERAALDAQTPSWPRLPPNTEAARLLDGLTALTSTDEVNRLAALSPQEEIERERFAEALATAKAEDPAKRATDIRLKAARLARLGQDVRDIAAQLGPGAVQQLVQLRREASESEALADQLARTFGDVTRLPGLGHRTWRQLWDAARAFSESAAYPGLAFPNTEDNAACVLCQQNLDAAAKDRFRKFAEFIGADAQQRPPQEEVNSQCAVGSAARRASAAEPARSHRGQHTHTTRKPAVPSPRTWGRPHRRARGRHLQGRFRDAPAESIGVMNALSPGRWLCS